MMNNRGFGVEIEIGNRAGLEMAKILRDAGFSVYCSEDRTMNLGGTWVNTKGKRPTEMDEYKLVWRVVRDGSVPDGCEVVSPVLSGAAGLTQVKNVVKAMNKAGAKATQDCGLHVHVSAGDLSVIELQNVARRYNAFETTIDTFVASRRRGNESRWCRSMDEVLRNIETSIFDENPKTFVEAIGDRYFKLNLQAYLRHGTVEFRQLEGTTSWTKIVNWIEFCVSFVEASRLNTETVTTYTQAALDQYRGLSSKARQLTRHFVVGIDDLSYILEIPESRVREAVDDLNKIIPGFLTPHLHYRNYWEVNRAPNQVSYPEVQGTWKDGIPVHVVAHMNHLARVQS